MQYTEEKLQKILTDHKLWLSGNGGKRADLRLADLSGADLPGANLTNADLYHADLSGADLSGANLTNADLSHADLNFADLSGANLSGANLRHADFYNTTFSNTLILGEPVNKAPLQLYGLPYFVLITNTMMQIGCQVHSIDEWLDFTVEYIENMDRYAKDFYEAYGRRIQDLAISHRIPKEANNES